jgi:hypothetical protein
MMKARIGRMAVAAVALAWAGAAHAGDTQDFSGCDGRAKPKSKEDGMRGEASISAFSRGAFGSGADARIAACDRALASAKLLPGQTLRRAHLLRARAAAYLEKNAHAKALSDLDAAEAALAPMAQEPLHRRSMGASLMLLRAIAKAGLGEQSEAERLAREAQALRPYALQVQVAAGLIRHASRPLDASSPAPWDDLLRLDPGMRRIVIAREAEVADFAGVVAAARALPIAWPDKPIGPYAVLATQGTGADFTAALDASLHLAYAEAATGDLAASRRTIALVREKVALLGASVPAAGKDTQPLTDAADNLVRTLKTSVVEPRLRLAEARIQLAEGHTAEARDAIVGTKVAANAATLDLLKALAKAGAFAQGLPL